MIYSLQRKGQEEEGTSSMHGMEWLSTLYSASCRGGVRRKRVLDDRSMLSLALVEGCQSSHNNIVHCAVRPAHLVLVHDVNVAMEEREWRDCATCHAWWGSPGLAGPHGGRHHEHRDDIDVHVK
jgi:hypothetical protein